jgi:hypothetical protein
MAKQDATSYAGLSGRQRRIFFVIYRGLGMLSALRPTTCPAAPVWLGRRAPKGQRRRGLGTGRGAAALVATAHHCGWSAHLRLRVILRPASPPNMSRAPPAANAYHLTDSVVSTAKDRTPAAAPCCFVYSEYARRKSNTALSVSACFSTMKRCLAPSRRTNCAPGMRSARTRPLATGTKGSSVP